MAGRSHAWPSAPRAERYRRHAGPLANRCSYTYFSAMNDRLPTPEDYEARCVCHAMRRAARAVTRRYEQRLRPLGLSAGQFTILAALNDGRAVPLGVLATALGMDRTTLTRDLKPLERKGLVASSKHSEDRRMRVLEITRRGRDLLVEGLPLWEAAQQDSLGRLGPPDWGHLRDRLQRLSG